MQAIQEINGLTVTIDGQEGPTVVFVHGWPDGPALWDGTVASLQDRYRCVRFPLPGYDLGKPPRPVSVDDMCELISGIVDAVSPQAPVTLVLHDWGCFFGCEYAARHQDRVARVVAADIGDTNSGAYLGRLSAKEKALIAGYQVWLAVAWKLGGWWPSLANHLTRFMANSVGWRSAEQQVGWQMNYPYAMQWFGSFGGLKGVARVDRVLGARTPVLFVYGKRKAFMFHSERWLKQLNETPGCETLGLEAGHWMMRQRPEAFNGAVRRWLDSSVRAQSTT